MSEIKLCYSFSARIDKLGFIDLVHSLHSVKKYFNKEDIIVFFTPPYSDEYQKTIEKYAMVIRKPHYSVPHPTQDPNDPTPPQYWDKFYFTEIDTKNLIFLDNDTELQCDIRKYFDNYDFDILVFGDDNRVDAMFLDTWTKTWAYFNMPFKHLLMTTVILFKHGTHQKIKPELEDIANKYMNGTFTFPAEDRLFDEYVFSLATRDYNVVIRPKNVDMKWAACNDTIDTRGSASILHGGSRRIFRVSNVPTLHETFDDNLLVSINQDIPTKHWIERVGATFLTMLEDEYPNFNIYFSLEENTIVMHTTSQLSQDIINRVYSYVWAEKPKQFNFTVRGDL